MKSINPADNFKDTYTALNAKIVIKALMSISDNYLSLETHQSISSLEKKLKDRDASDSEGLYKEEVIILEKLKDEYSRIINEDESEDGDESHEK